MALSSSVGRSCGGAGVSRCNFLELLELAGHLRDEKLFVTQERDALNQLFNLLDESSKKAHSLNWVLQQQKCLTTDLIMGSQLVTPDVCCSKFNALEEAAFIDGYKLLTHHEIRIGKFLKGLRESPKLVALCLFHAENMGMAYLQQTMRTVMLQLYGGLILLEDELLAVSMVRHLLRLEFNSGKVGTDPLKFVSKWQTAFGRAYRLLTECLPSSKPFLTLAFHDPTVALLSEDEWYYDLESDKALGRFSPQELQKQFGRPDSDSYRRKVDVYMGRITDRLVELVTGFMQGIRFGVPIFPKSLAIVVGEAFRLFSQLENFPLDSPKKKTASDAGSFSDDRKNAAAKEACLYLLFNTFLCPAICDPVIRGIVFDTPVGEVARHNLMQIAQVLQVLALSPVEVNEANSKYKELCARFDQDCLSFLLDTIIGSCSREDEVKDVSAFNPENPDHPQRSSVLISPREFVELLEVAHETSSLCLPPLGAGDDHQRQLKELISDTNLPQMTVIKSLCQKYLGHSRPDAPFPCTPTTHGDSHKPAASSLSLSVGSAVGGGRRKTNFEDHNGIKSATSRHSNPIFIHSFPQKIPLSWQEAGQQQQQQDVFVINLGMYSECPGMISEHKVLESEMKLRKQKLEPDSILPGEDDHHHHHNSSVKECSFLISEKRTRFSLSHDTDSIEPNNEVVSEEAVSSHSTDDDDDDEEDNNSNDNLSDMAYSANLSGRNTPSIVSGRDTPVSFVSGGPGGAEDGTSRSETTERVVIAEVVINTNRCSATASGRLDSRGDSANAGGAASFGEGQAAGGRVVSVVVGGGGARAPGDGGTGRKREVRRDDVTDRFGKFDIKQDIELEAKSTVSDTWSTDVLASDSEPPPEQNHLDRLEEVVEEIAILPPRAGGPGIAGMGGAVSETGISETASDAWSTDVLASDTSERQSERLLELDQDEPCLLSGRNTLSLSGLNVSIGDLALDKNVLPSSDKQHSPQGGGVRPFSSPMRSKADRPYDNLSDGSSHKESSNNNFEVFEDTCASNPRKSNFRKREYSMFGHPEGPSTGETDPESSNLLRFSDDGDYKPNNNKLPGNNVVNNNNSGDFFANSSSGFFQDLSDDSESAPRNLKVAGSYDEGFNCFDPLAPYVPSPYASEGVTRVQGRELLKSANSSSADNLDVLVPPSANLFAASRSSSSMNHILDQFETPPFQSLPLTANIADESFSSKQNDERLREKSALKKKSGILGTFREKLSKVNQASKRKTVRGQEEPSQSIPPVLIDFDPPADVEASVTSSVDVKQHAMANSWNESVNNTESILAKYRKSSGHQSTSSMSLSSASIQSSRNGTQQLQLQTQNLQQQQQQDNLLSLPTFSPTSSHSISPLFHQPFLGSWCGGNSGRRDSKIFSGSQTPALGSDAFSDTKKKLRLVLSKVDCCQLKEGRGWLKPVDCAKEKRQQEENPVPVVGNCIARSKVTNYSPGDNELVMLLKALLAESIVGDDRVLATQLQEAVRCLSGIQAHEIKRLLKSLRDDYKQRSCYIAYLTRCKKSLLASIAFYDKLLSKINKEKSVVSKYLVSVMTRLYLEKKEMEIVQFISEFQTLQLFDEKSDLLGRFLNEHHEDMRNDSSWIAATDSQLDEAQLCMERTVMSHIYTHALFPNGDVDISRDKILEDHMRNLAEVITPDHKDLKISPSYHNECPWLAAQKELVMINAFKTPEDKLECVMRCCSTIMTLLSLALTGGSTAFSGGVRGTGGEGDGGGSPSKSNGGVPAADDFMPVLIYVIIMSGTSNLLSTIQYVKSYCASFDAGDCGAVGGTGGRQRNVFADGEKLYWWMQFVAAVEFIKTMDYQK